ncbi:hypothetical protein BC834DRAFT_475745 [Gloeopeniophorella convolvens]|nr:hypothetical protein BC834DRAFT_475745 [Gloeopeniophorella convolvens]
MDALSLAESVKYITAAGVTITYWDHFLTIGDELKYIWKRPFAEVKVLYIVCRYTQTATFIFISFGINGLLRAESDDLQGNRSRLRLILALGVHDRGL